jgi:hypothetical protein
MRPDVAKPAGGLFVEIKQSFVHLDIQVVDNDFDEGSDSDWFTILDKDYHAVEGGQRINNHLTYLQDHPASYFMDRMDMRSFLSPPGIYVVPDYRVDKSENNMREIQLLFAICFNDNNLSWL